MARVMAGSYVPFDDSPSNKNGHHSAPTTQRSIHQIVLPDDDDGSSIGDDYEVASITSSIEDQLT